MKKETGFVDWDLAELYLALKKTMELEIELVKKLDKDIEMLEKMKEKERIKKLVLK